MRFMLFDEVVFERQRVDFRFGYYIIEIGDIGNHRRDLFRFLRGIEILLDSVFKNLRLSDVNYLSVLIQHNVYARGGGQHRYFVFQHVVNG